MLYTIKCVYDTGNSFGTHTEEETLNFKWSLKTAKANLQRIKEHYLYYEANNNHRYWYSPEEEAEAARIIKEAPSKDWYDKQYDFLYIY